MSGPHMQEIDEDDTGDLGIGTESPIQRLGSAAAPSEAVPIEHFDRKVLSHAFEFVKANLESEMQKSAPEEGVKVQIQGLGRKFYQHQLGAAFWLLVRERSQCRGGILADKMGLGKTATVLLYIYLNNLLVENALEVAREPQKHQIPPDNGPCPSQESWPIQCKCVAGGIIQKYQLTPRPGASLVVAPAMLLATWEEEFVKLQVSSTERLRLYIQHRGNQDEGAPLDERRHLALYGHGERDMAKSALHKHSHAHKVILVTTSGSYDRHVLRRFTCYRQWRDPNSGEVRGLTDGIAYGRVVRDEAHLASNEGSEFDEIMESLMHNGWILPNFVAVTGTPLPRNEIDEILPMFNWFNRISPDLQNDPTLRGICTREGLLQAFTPDDVAHALAAYAIQRTDQTRQLGRVLARVPSLQIRDVSCVSRSSGPWELNDTNRTALVAQGRTQNLAGEVDAAPKKGWKRRLLMETIPGLTRVDSSWTTWKHIKSNNWHGEPEASDIFAMYDQLEATSAKFQQLRAIISALNPKDGDHPSGQALDQDSSTLGKESRKNRKLVVVSFFPVVCFAVRVLCMKLGITCEWLHAGLDCAARAEKIDHFQNVTELGQEDESIQVIVGTYRIVGQGINLTAAQHLVLMEPHESLAMEYQVFRRVCRIGSTAKVCWIFRLHDAMSDLEMDILSRQASQLAVDAALQGSKAENSPSQRAVGGNSDSTLLQPEPEIEEDVDGFLEM